MTPPEPHTLRARIREVIGRGASAPLDDAEFDALARAVFAHQFAHNPIYRAYCEQRGASPRTVDEWTAIPAVPTDAFKAAPLLCGDPAAARVVFRTSGTTAGRERRGEHWFLDTMMYDAALRAGFAAHLLPEGGPMRVVSLVPSAADLPDSSLSHMLDQVLRHFGTETSGCYVDAAHGLRLDALIPALHAAEAAAEPVLIAGTSFAFVHLLDALDERAERVRLPVGSRIMDTGGFKGRSREVERAELYAAMEQGLGVATAWCVNEYGMTEMSSQFYDAVAGAGATAVARRRHRGPSWVRTRAVDPETLRLLPPGETGVLRHLDLANVDSVAALQTADLGRVGEEGIELLGRARGAEARGCSIAMDELLSVLGRRF